MKTVRILLLSFIALSAGIQMPLAHAYLFKVLKEKNNKPVKPARVDHQPFRLSGLMKAYAAVFAGFSAYRYYKIHQEKIDKRAREMTDCLKARYARVREKVNRAVFAAKAREYIRIRAQLCPFDQDLWKMHQDMYPVERVDGKSF